MLVRTGNIATDLAHGLKEIWKSGIFFFFDWVWSLEVSPLVKFMYNNDNTVKPLLSRVYSGSVQLYSLPEYSWARHSDPCSRYPHHSARPRYNQQLNYYLILWFCNSRLTNIFTENWSQHSNDFWTTSTSISLLPTKQRIFLRQFLTR